MCKDLRYPAGSGVQPLKMHSVLAGEEKYGGRLTILGDRYPVIAVALL